LECARCGHHLGGDGGPDRSASCRLSSSSSAPWMLLLLLDDEKGGRTTLLSAAVEFLLIMVALERCVPNSAAVSRKVMV